MTQTQALQAHLSKKPLFGKNVFIAPNATVIGDVQIGDFSSVWYGAVLRGDINRIAIGHHTNVQDNAVLHLERDLPCRVGHYVTIGHGAIIHACTIGDLTLIGMGSTLLDGAEIGEECLIGANALVTPGTKIPPGSMVLGLPAKAVRALTAQERRNLRTSADHYSAAAAFYLDLERTRKSKQRRA